MTRFNVKVHAELEDLPNIGPAIAGDLRSIGITTPRMLKGKSPARMYAALNKSAGTRHDPCVLDTFMAAVDFVNGAPAKPWWSYTPLRKRK